MPRGENPAFKERVGVLSEPLLHRNVKRHLRSISDDRVDVEALDLEAFIDPSLTYSENWQLIEEHLPVSDEEIDPDQLENELEKYAYLWRKFKERHDIE